MGMLILKLSTPRIAEICVFRKFTGKEDECERNVNESLCGKIVEIFLNIT